ncbi:MAG TPA: hypothetical protein VKU80_17895 [Planctomycetota bacterium]|nr:hypothetical protein [Planctomycetota bacterium]
MSLDTSSPGDLVAVGFKSGRACIWDLHVGKIIRTFETPGCWVKTVRFSPDAKSLVTGGSNGELRRWSVSTGQLLLTLKGHAGAILAATYSPSGDRIAISGADKTIRIWEVGGGKDPVILRGHRFVASALGFSPDGSVLASISGSCDYPEAGGPLGMTIEYAVGDGKIVLWNAQTGAEIQSID